MSELLNRLFGLKDLAFGQNGVELGWERPLPGWAWALVIAVCLGAGIYGYRRIQGRMLWRGPLAVVRALVLLALVVLIAGPKLVKPNETEERDWVLVLADRSRSLSVPDAPGVAPRTRDAQLTEALSAATPVFTKLGQEHSVVWMGFDAAAYEVGGADAGPVPVLPEASGRRTAIGRALEQALRRAAARPVSGIVILSDGRSSDEVPRSVLKQLQAEKIPVVAVPLGSAEAVRDIAIRSVEGPKVAFVNDLVPVIVELEKRGGKEGPESWGAVQLVDKSTGIVLDERPLDEPATGAGEGEGSLRTITLTAKPGSAESGKGAWEVRLAPGGSDLVAENNRAEVDIELVDRPLRVLYFDGYPRWENRYLKTLFVREKSMKSTSIILAAGLRFLQEGDELLGALPHSPEEWREFDVIVMGDLRPELFTTEQLEQIRDHVGLDGAGLLWIGGEANTPGAWAGTPLADLIPFALAGSGSTTSASAWRSGGITSWGEPVFMAPTPMSERLGVLRLTERQPDGSYWPRPLSDPRTGWSKLRWAQRIDRAILKPSAEVLATVKPDQPNAEPSPAVIAMRFGAGRSLYVGTDEIWRWRYGRGEDLPERFWLQLVRFLGRESAARAGKPARLEVSPARAIVEQPVRITLELADQRLIDSAPANVKARLMRTGDVDRRTPAEESGESGEILLTPEGSGAPGAPARRFSTTWTGTASGRYRVNITDALIAESGLSAEFEVWLPEDEMRHPESDHPHLARLAEATGGTVLRPDQLAQLESVLPNRKIRLVGTPDEKTLWDTPAALILMVVLLVIEWVGRRLIKLV